MKIRLYYIGKPRSRPLNQAASEYGKRLTRFCRFEAVEIKSEKSVIDSKAMRVVLDPRGRQSTSEQFARLLETAGRDVDFFIGGADGWGDEFRSSADVLLSLSKMTLPHELARVLLIEQVYRAFTILQGHPYAR